jgi:hypothetical protein
MSARVPRGLTAALGLCLAFAVNANGAAAGEPLTIRALASSPIDLRLVQDQVLPSKYANTRLVLVRDINGDGKSEVVMLDGPRSSATAGYTGNLIAYGWQGDSLRQITPEHNVCRFELAHDLAAIGTRLWAGSGDNLCYCDWMEPGINGTHYRAALGGLPPVTVLPLLDGSVRRLFVGCVGAEHATPGGTANSYRFVVLSTGTGLTTVAEIDPPLLCSRPWMVAGDFDSDGREEVAISAPFGDSAAILWSGWDVGWTWQVIAQHVGAGHVVGAADVDADGRTELVVGGYGLSERDGLWCYEWRDGKPQFDRDIAVPEHLRLAPCTVADVFGDADPELIYISRSRQTVTVYALE